MSGCNLPWQENDSAVVCDNFETYCSKEHVRVDRVRARPGTQRVVKGSPRALRMLVKYTVPAPSQGRK
jgi:hypothetical protein